MPIRNLRNLYTLVSVLVVLSIGATVFWASREVSAAIAIDRVADEINREAATLRYLAIDTILYFEPRSKQQWQSRYDALTRTLADLDLAREHQEAIAHIRREHRSAGVLYARMLDYHNSSLANEAERKPFEELKARAASRLMGVVQEMQSDTFQLSSASHMHAAASQRRLSLLIAIFAVVIGAIVVGNWVLITRNVLAPVERLQKGTEIVAAGDLAHRTAVDRADEIGSLARAFNAMTSTIQATTAALRGINEELERRVQERTAALDAALDELRRSEQHYRMLFDANPHPMWVYDLRTLNVLAANDAAVGQYGYTKDEYLKMRIDMLRVPAERVLVPAAIRGIDPAKRHHGFYRFCKKNGDPVDVEVISDGISFDGKQARLVLAVDITERKRAQEEVQRLNAELEERVRRRTSELEAVNRELEAFSYSVSHDLRSPLRHVAGYADLLKEEAADVLQDRGKHYLDNITDSIAEMGKLIDDLLAFSKMGRTEMQRTRIPMNAVVEEVVQELSRTTKGRRIEWDIRPLPDVRGDPAMIKQVWVNLIGNAVKYTRNREIANIRIGYTDRNGEPEFYVADNGAGFDMAYADKLFGVFQRLHHPDEFEGTGVGLANVQRIVMRHGGRIRAQSAVDQGATFYFTLPNTEVANDTVKADPARRRQREGH